MQQFSISNHTKNQIQQFLDERNVNLQTAMDDETMNRELAALLHAGLPAMVRKFYGRAKMEALFADKKDMIYTAIAQRLQQPDDKKGKK